MTASTFENYLERTLDHSYWLHCGPHRPSVGAWPQQTFRFHSNHCSWHRRRILRHLRWSEHRLVSFGSRRRFDWSNRGRSSCAVHLEPSGREPRYQRSRHSEQFRATPLLLIHANIRAFLSLWRIDALPTRHFHPAMPGAPGRRHDCASSSKNCLNQIPDGAIEWDDFCRVLNIP